MFVIALAVFVVLDRSNCAADDVQAEMRALVNKAIKALGGESRVKELDAVTWKATSSFDRAGTPYTWKMEGSFRGWEQARLDSTFEAGGGTRSGTTIINGNKGWSKNDNGQAELKQGIVSLFKGYFYPIRLAQMPALLKDKAYTLSALGEMTIRGRPAVGVKAIRKGCPDADVFFDRETGLPLKCQAQIKLSSGKEPVFEFFLSKPRDMGAVKHFTEIEFHRDGVKYLTIEVTEVKPSADLDADLFAKP
jgi:hypothetical protein